MTREECMIALELCDYVKDSERQDFWGLLHDHEDEIPEADYIANIYALMHDNRYKKFIENHAYYKAWHTKQAILDDMANAGWMV